MNTLLFENIDKQILLMKINRPNALNALNQKTLEEILNFLQQQSYNTTIRCLIITGAGDKSFIAGADIKEMLLMDLEELQAFFQLGQDVTMALSKASFPVIAAVNGFCLGGGLEIALAADFIYASTQAKFGLPEVSLGVIPVFGGTQRLSRAIGSRLAKELIMTGRIISAKEAKKVKLINKICEPKKLIQECVAVAKEIVKHSPCAIRQGKRAIDFGFHLSMDEALELEKNEALVAFASDERKEKMKAFVERKKQ